MRALTVLLALAATAIVGCSSSTAGTARPATPTGGADATEPTASDPPVPSSSDDVQAPRVDQPLDVTEFLPNPCEVLTADQLAGFQVTTPGRPNTTGAVAENVGPACNWTTDLEIPSGLSVSFITGNENGLTDIYRLHADGQFPDFEPTEVDGYPAVIANALADDRANGHCGINVGISNELVFFVQQTGRLDAEESCARVRQIAEAVLVTVKASQ